MTRVKTYNSENAVKKEINRLLDLHKWFWWSTPMNGFGKSGISDKLAYKDGVLMAIEAKYGNNKPTALQRAFLDSIRAENGFGFVVHDKNIEWFAGFLAAFERAKINVAKRNDPEDEDGALMINAIRELTRELS